MLVSMKEILDHANEHNYAVAAPNVSFELEARAYLQAAEKMNAPVILDVAFFTCPDTITQGWYLRQLAEQASVPVAINQDHGAQFCHAIAAIRGGFTGIMVDRSQLPFEKNIAQVKELVRIAHCVDVSVEAELGHVGDGGVYDQNDRSTFTKPEEALRYVQETEVDCLAVAIGSAHGPYKGIPKLDFDLLKQIKETVKIPLVLHGGSGTGDENLAKACRMGINKVNVFSELAGRAYDEVIRAPRDKEPAYLIFNHLQDGFGKRLCDLMELFGSRDKNWSDQKQGLLGRRIVFGEGSDAAFPG